MKKKIVLITISLIILLVAAIIAVPLFFKSKIIKIAKEEANKSLLAFIDFDEHIRINIVSDFPKLHVKVSDLVVANKEPFSGDTLAKIGTLKVSLDMKSVIKGKLEVLKMSIDQADVFIHVLSDTSEYLANWDIFLPSEDTTESPVITIPVKDYKITNSHFTWKDERNDFFIEFTELNHSGKGDFSLDLFDLVTETSVEQSTFIYDGIAWISKARMALDALVKIDLVNDVYSFAKSQMKLNDFPLNFDGYIAMPEDDIEMKVDFRSPETDFKYLLSLVPAIYSNDFEDIKASGTMSFSGNVDGKYGDTSFPAFNVDLAVKQGSFKYPDLPDEVRDVNITMNVDNPDGNLDHTVVNISRMHAVFGKEPFDILLLLKTPLSDPYVKSKIKGKINLEHVKDYIKLDQKLDISGLMQADLEIEGKLSYLEKEEYEKFGAKGLLLLKDLRYYSDDFKKNLHVPLLKMEFSPQYVDLQEMQVKIDKNDLLLKGKLQHFIPYFFGKGTLKGTMDISSNYLNLNDFLTSEEPTNVKDEKSNQEESTSLTVFELPGNVDFQMSGKVKQLIYDRMDMKEVACKLHLKDRRLTVEELRANLFKGSIVAGGFYETINPEKPNASFTLNVTNVNIKEAYRTFGFVSKFMAIAQFAEGVINGSIEMSSPLEKNMMPLFAQLFSKGVLSIKELKVMDFPPLNSMAEAIQMKQYKNLTINNIKPSYKIENGRFELRPVTFKINKTVFQVKGVNSLDKQLNYEIKMDVPSEDIRKQSVSWLSKMGTKLEELPVGETIPLYVYLTGTIEKPKVTTSLGKSAKSVVEAGKERVVQEADKKKQEAVQKLKEEANKQKAILEQQAKTEAERIKAEAARKKKEAEDKARIEAEKKKKQLEEEAKKKIRDVLK